MAATKAGAFRIYRGHHFQAMNAPHWKNVRHSLTFPAMTMNEAQATLARLIAEKKTRSQIATEMRRLCARHPALFDGVIDLALNAIESGSAFGLGHAAPASQQEAGLQVPDSTVAGQYVGAQNTKGILPATVDIPVALAASALRKHGLELERQLSPQALSARDYERRAEIRGESWLLSYAIPGGPVLLDMPATALAKMRDRMMKEAVDRGQAALLINAIMREVDKRGRLGDGDMRPVRDFLTPRIIATLTTRYSAEAIRLGLRDLRKHFRDFANPEIVGPRHDAA